MKNLNLKCLNSFMNFLKFIKINDHPNGFEKAERSVGHFFFFLFQMSNSRTSSPIAYNVRGLGAVACLLVRWENCAKPVL